MPGKALGEPAVHDAHEATRQAAAEALLAGEVLEQAQARESHGAEAQAALAAGLEQAGDGEETAGRGHHDQIVQGATHRAPYIERVQRDDNAALLDRRSNLGRASA